MRRTFLSQKQQVCSLQGLETARSRLQTVPNKFAGSSRAHECIGLERTPASCLAQQAESVTRAWQHLREHRMFLACCALFGFQNCVLSQQCTRRAWRYNFYNNAARYQTERCVFAKRRASCVLRVCCIAVPADRHTAACAHSRIHWRQRARQSTLADMTVEADAGPSGAGLRRSGRSTRAQDLKEPELGCDIVTKSTERQSRRHRWLMLPWLTANTLRRRAAYASVRSLKTLACELATVLAGACCRSSESDEDGFDLEAAAEVRRSCSHMLTPCKRLLVWVLSQLRVLYLVAAPRRGAQLSYLKPSKIVHACSCPERACRVWAWAFECVRLHNEKYVRKRSAARSPMPCGACSLVPPAVQAKRAARAQPRRARAKPLPADFDPNDLVGAFLHSQWRLYHKRQSGYRTTADVSHTLEIHTLR